MAPTPSITEISDTFVDRYAVLDPVRAARSMGVGRDAEELTDYSPEGQQAIAGLARSTLEDLGKAEPTDEAERLGGGFLEDQCRAEIALHDAGERKRMVSAIVGPPSSIRMAFDLMSRSSDDDWERVAARLERVPEALAGYRDSLETSLASGQASSRRLAAAAAEQCTTWAGTGDGGWFATYVADHGDGPVKARLDAAAVTAATAYGELGTWLAGDYAAAADPGDGVGEDRYRVWALAILGTDLDVAEAYEWGCEEWARLEAEKALECERIEPGAGFDAVRDRLDVDPAHGVAGVDAFRERLQELTDEAIEALSGEEFDIAPELHRCVVSIPPEGSASAPYYTPPSEDLAQPGQVWFPAMGRSHFAMWSEVTTAYHEAVPGHHLQLGVTRILPLTRAHRVGFNTAHGEGWALYAERLMDELGWFRTPETRLGFLCMQAMRAARIAVDIGLHTGRPVPPVLAGIGGLEAGATWTYELAIQAMRHAGALGEPDATSEVLRYLSWPSQATAYKLGERSWLAGRAAAVAAASGTFDRKAWHGRALALGPLGLDRLEKELATLR